MNETYMNPRSFFLCLDILEILRRWDACSTDGYWGGYELLIYGLRENDGEEYKKKRVRRGVGLLESMGYIEHRAGHSVDGKCVGAGYFLKK